jgi:hypothetical protein
MWQQKALGSTTPRSGGDRPQGDLEGARRAAPSYLVGSAILITGHQESVEFDDAA